MNYDYVNYYQDTLNSNGISESEVTLAANCASSNKLSSLLSSISLFKSTLNSIIIDWDDKGEKSFALSKNSILKQISTIEGAVDSYSQAEQAYIDLDIQLKLLKTSTNNLLLICRKKPSHSNSKYEISKTTTLENGSVSKEKSTNWDKYYKDLRLWRDQVESLKSKCKNMQDTISQIVIFLKNFDSLSINDINVSFTLPSYNIVGQIDGLYDLEGDYGVNQHIIQDNINFQKYELLDDSFFEKYGDLLRENNISFNDYLSPLSFKSLSKIFIKEYGEEEASLILSNYFMGKRGGNMDNVIGYVMDKYNIKNEYDCVQLLSSIDTNGVCDYAATASFIFDLYNNNESQFEKDFGFPMYYVKDEKSYHNSEMLLADMFFSINSGNQKDVFSKTTLFKTDSDDVLIPRSGIYEDLNDKGKVVCISNVASKYLSSKNSELQINGNSYADNEYAGKSGSFGGGTKYDFQKCDSISSLIKESIENGNYVNLSVKSGSTVHGINNYLKHSDNSQMILGSNHISENYVINGAHEMHVTKVTDDGIYLSTWGQEAYMSYDEVEEYGYYIDVYDVKGI